MDTTDLKSLKYSVKDLIPKIHEYLSTLELDLAYKFMEKAIALSPTDPVVLELAGMVEMELAEKLKLENSMDTTHLDNAYNYFRKSIELQPDSGYSKFLYMGQIVQGPDAMVFFERGVELLIKEIEKLSSSESSSSTTPTTTNPDDEIQQLVQDIHEKTILARKLSSALCSMTELYMTDLCDLPEAESKCESYTSQALQFDSTNPEVWQILASVRLSQCRVDDAKECLKKCLENWLGSCEAGDFNFPSFNSRMGMVKLLLELAPTEENNINNNNNAVDNNQSQLLTNESFYDKALSVLQTLQLENDQDVELWYLYGWCYWCMGGGLDLEEQRSQGRELNKDGLDELTIGCFEDARECFGNVVALFERIGYHDEAIVEHARELLMVVVALIGEGEGDDKEDEEIDEAAMQMDAEDEEWMNDD